MPLVAKLLGIRLIVRLGTTLQPPPPEVLNAISRISVTNDGSGQDGFSITFTLTKQTLDYSLLASGLLDPPNRVVIGVVMGVVPEVLIDGVITHHQLSPSADPGASTLTVMGRDWSEMMNLAERSQQFPNQADHVIFGQLVANYAEFGAVPDAAPAIRSTPIMTQQTPAQVKTDLGFIRDMAARNGYVFYTEPVTFGVNRAYFGPQKRAGVPQPALTHNMGAASNVTQISFSNDALAETAATGTVVIEGTSVDVLVPSPKVPPLAARRTILKTTIERAVANVPMDQAIATLLGDIMNAPDAVQGSGQVDSLRYGAVLRARGLVGVRGVGTHYDGLYYVRSVTHSITPTDYSQQFSLSREGVLPTVPAVVP
jgi:hypothetical protein